MYLVLSVLTVSSIRELNLTIFSKFYQITIRSFYIFTVKKLLRRLYSIYVAATFVGTFFIFMPVFIIGIYIPGAEKYGLLANHWWAKIFFPLVFASYQVEFRFRPDQKQNYVLCANHFSFFDIPSMALFPLPFKFIGKKSLAKTPLLGFVFKKLHIMVDRQEARSRSGSLKRGLVALDKGLSLMIFPEGGIFSTDPPEMVAFKEGAFRAAITKKVPVVPVTIPYNHIILPDDNRFLFKRHRFKIIFHEPVSTENMSLEDVPGLKENIYQLIDQELKKHL